MLEGLIKSLYFWRVMLERLIKSLYFRRAMLERSIRVYISDVLCWNVLSKNWI